MGRASRVPRSWAVDNKQTWMETHATLNNVTRAKTNAKSVGGRGGRAL